MGFPARYRGVCADCEEWFGVGASITYDSHGEIVHVRCPGQPDDVSMGDGKPCPKCFCYHKGECL